MDIQSYHLNFENPLRDVQIHIYFVPNIYYEILIYYVFFEKPATSSKFKK